MEALSIEDVLKGQAEGTRKIVQELHQVAIDNGCKYRVRPGDTGGKHTITYSARSYRLDVDGDRVSLAAAYDIRGLLDFYRHEADETARGILFDAVEPCQYCISDKCTTLVSDRTISFQGKSKKPCGPYRHWLNIADVTPSNLPSVKAIAKMVFWYCTPAMHADLFLENEITQETVAAPGMTVIGFRYAAASFGVSVEDFIQECLASGKDGKRKIDTLLALTGQADQGRYIGVTTQLVNGACYQLTFGVAYEKSGLPAELPKDVDVVKVLPGDYAVYRSSAGDYRSVWQRWSETYYDSEHKGYDTARVPYEYYDREGTLGDVYIPVSADCPKDNGRRTRVTLTPDITVAGLLSCNETDHPFYKDDTGVLDKLLKCFPHAERIVYGSIHSAPGQPMLTLMGVEVDKLDVVPPDLELITIRGGYWNIVSYPYFRSGEYEFNPPYKARFAVENLAHPRAFLEMRYTGRGLYSEIYTPIMRIGERRVELVERSAWRLIGKEEAPPASVVTDSDIRAFYDLRGNVQRGRCVFAFRYEIHRDLWFFSRPIIKGAEVADAAGAPRGLKAYTLEGGKYAKISETLPNGEYDWRSGWYAFREMEKADGYQLDLSRLFVVEQTGYGRSFALYAPVR